MKIYTASELAEIIEKHGKWLHGEEGGERANLSDANLRNADLSDADLSDANLRNADLSDADLSDANLRNADLRNADLSYANLSDANLRNADLSDADLSDANLRNANLRDADLSDANLSYADLRYADLSEIKSLWGASGNCSEIKAVQCDTWPVTYTAERMQIGCQFHAIEEWWAFSDDEISRMDSKALDWWRIWKPILQTIIAASPAVPGCSAAE